VTGLCQKVASAVVPSCSSSRVHLRPDMAGGG
jgi:hypothetical protein